MHHKLPITARKYTPHNLSPLDFCQRIQQGKNNFLARS